MDYIQGLEIEDMLETHKKITENFENRSKNIKNTNLETILTAKGEDKFNNNILRLLKERNKTIENIKENLIRITKNEYELEAMKNKAPQISKKIRNKSLNIINEKKPGNKIRKVYNCSESSESNPTYKMRINKQNGASRKLKIGHPIFQNGGDEKSLKVKLGFLNSVKPLVQNDEEHTIKGNIKTEDNYYNSKKVKLDGNHKTTLTTDEDNAGKGLLQKEEPSVLLTNILHAQKVTNIETEKDKVNAIASLPSLNNKTRMNNLKISEEVSEENKKNFSERIDDINNEVKKLKSKKEIYNRRSVNADRKESTAGNKILFNINEFAKNEEFFAILRKIKMKQESNVYRQISNNDLNYIKNLHRTEHYQELEKIQKRVEKLMTQDKNNKKIVINLDDMTSSKKDDVIFNLTEKTAYELRNEIIAKYNYHYNQEECIFPIIVEEEQQNQGIDTTKYDLVNRLLDETKYRKAYNFIRIKKTLASCRQKSDGALPSQITSPLFK